MPVSVAKSGEGPLHGIPRQAALQMGILENIRRIIKVDELVVADGIVENEGRRHQEETADDEAHFAGGRHVGRWRRLRWQKVRCSSTISRLLPAAHDSNVMEC